jgi:hypothetical protein
MGEPPAIIPLILSVSDMTRARRKPTEVAL